LPDAVRAMIPRDWLIIKQGYDAQARAGRPGADAPSAAQVAELVERYG